MMEPVVILHGSSQYKQACKLRDEILRRPLGLSLYAEDLQTESTFYHYGIFDEDTIIACVVAVPDTGALVQIRQMAVVKGSRSKGVGTRLLEYTEGSLLKKGFSNFFLNARREAVPFYQKLGYRPIGDEFLEVSIPHRKMEKNG